MTYKKNLPKEERKATLTFGKMPKYGKPNEFENQFAIDIGMIDGVKEIEISGNKCYEVELDIPLIDHLISHLLNVRNGYGALHPVPLLEYPKYLKELGAGPLDYSDTNKMCNGCGKKGYPYCNECYTEKVYQETMSGDESKKSEFSKWGNWESLGIIDHGKK